MVSSSTPPSRAKRRSSSHVNHRTACTRPDRRLDLRAARLELGDLIDWKSPDQSSADAELYSISTEQEQRVLELLRTHNTLASESFSDCRPLKNKYPPLAFLVEKNASLPCIREVFAMFPGAIHYKDRWGNTPLHFACMARASAAAMEFLVERDPDAKALPNRVGYCPLHFILSGRSGRELTRQHIDVLLPRAQQSLLMTNDLGLTPLDLSLKSNLSATALEYLFQVASDSRTISSFSVPARTDDGRFGLKHARALANLLPTLTTFTYTQCHGKMWTNKAFCHLVKAMGCSTQLEKVVMDVPRRILITDPDAQQALQEMMANAPNLRELTLRNEERSGILHHVEDEYGDDGWIAALVRGFEINQTLEQLVLYGVCLQNATPLMNLLSGPHQPQTLHLLGLTVLSDLDNIQQYQDLSKCRCETILLEGPNWDHQLLPQLGQMPRLARLRIAYTGPSDLSVPLALLIQQSPSLRHLEVSAGCCVKNQDRLVDALQTSVTLEKYTYANGMNRESKARIAYYTNLNKYGRKQASASNFSKLDFVNMLGAAAEDEDLKPFWRQIDLFNIHFGLLSLNPSLWIGGQRGCERHEHEQELMILC
ncbi:expressed unknown protein [Seminavis robusta]|uniref:Uncharacterized protein n=1 Tax=Seminavis robusta TaxID=568900 RepID=A0A9N8EJD2_9STRA|nr:expressed unknown protein [Seminavis robusta]|eukprot:Sro1094_g240540.1 n/a (596) ;mRNA; f:15445-17232